MIRRFLGRRKGTQCTQLFSTLRDLKMAMQVRLEVLFDNPTAEDAAAMRSLARGLTDHPESVRVVPKQRDPNCQIAEFSIPTQPQDRAVRAIDGSIRQ